MIILLWIQLFGIFGGLALVFYAAQYRTEDYPSFSERSPLAIVRLRELRVHFTGPGYALHRAGVWLVTIGLFSGAFYFVRKWLFS